MPPTRRHVLVAMAATTVLAGCTQGDGSIETTTTDRATTAPPADDPTTVTDAATETEGSTGDETTTTAASATVRVASHPDLGDVLVGPEGRTLYMFDSDTQGEGASTCSGGCAEAWPPLTVEGEASAGPDVTTELGTFERGDGSTQVAADGWPLYYFANDEEPGDANGQGVNDVWWVVRPDGTPVRSTMATNSTETAIPTSTETTTPSPTPTETESDDDDDDSGGGGPY